MHKGTIRAYNGESGTVFEITLPPGGQINADVVHQVRGLKRHRFFREAHRSATIRYRCSSSARWQATRRPATGRSCGTSRRQRSVA